MEKSILVVAAVIISSPLLSQEKKADSISTLDEVVITANKFEQKQSTTGKVITVIGAEQLQKSAGRSLSQVLNEQAGLTVNGALNAAGSVQTVYMRGASSGRTQILVDGIPVNDPSMINNEFDLNLIAIQDVERIEICKGAQSTLYGSDAIAGVINIITIKKDLNKPFYVKGSSAFGNKNTSKQNIQLYGKLKKLSYSTRFSKFRTDGFSSAYDSTNSKGFDRDDYDANNINATLQYQLLPALLVKTFILHSQYKASIDEGIFTDDRDYRIRNSNLSSGAGLSFKKGIVMVNANYQYGELSRKYRNDSTHIGGFSKFVSNQYGGRTQYAEIYGNISPLKWISILAGADYRWANMEQQYLSISAFGPYESSFPDTSMHQYSFYGSVILNALNKRFNLEAGGRINKHSRYGTNSTYTFNPSFALNKHLRIFGSIASGYKAPSIFQLFDAFSGSPELKAEKSVNVEGGIQQQHEKISSRLVYFHRKIRNGIDFNYIDYKYFNFVKQVVDGIEFELNVKPVKPLAISLNYTYLSGKEKTQNRKNYNDTTYKYLLRRPKHSINVNAGYQFTEKLFASVSAKYVSDRYDVGGYQRPDIKMESYLLLNAYAAYTLNSNIRFFADAQNITDKKFFDIRGYNGMPFLFGGGVSFSW